MGNFAISPALISHLHYWKVVYKAEFITVLDNKTKEKENQNSDCAPNNSRIF